MGPLLAVAAVWSAYVTTASFNRARQAEAESVKRVIPCVSMVVAVPTPTSAFCSTGRSQKKHSPSPASLAAVKTWIVSYWSIGRVKLASTDRCCSAARLAASRKVLSNGSWSSVISHFSVPVVLCAPIRLEIATFILLSTSNLVSVLKISLVQSQFCSVKPRGVTAQRFLPPSAERSGYIVGPESAHHTQALMMTII